jgi:hypothetical protein
MLAFLKTPVFAAVAIFLVAFAACSLIAGPETCQDGWKSPSIGRPGACSHHGGVTNKWRIVMLISLLSGGAAYGLTKPRYKMDDDFRTQLSDEIAEADKRIAAVQAELDRSYFLCPDCRKVMPKPSDYRDGEICTECVQYRQEKGERPDG